MLNLTDYQNQPDNETLAYVVMNENLLGYLYKLNQYFYVGQLASSIIRGGPSYLDGPRPVSPLDQLRKATPADFEAYRVSSKGYQL